MNKKNYLLTVIFFLLACNNATNTPTKEISESITSNPTSTLALTQTSIPTLIEAPTLSLAQATQEFLIKNYSEVCTRPIPYSLRLSPNEQWITLNCYTQSGESINIIKTDKSIKWDVSYFELSKQNVFVGYVIISHWSQDGNYLYLRIFPQIDGGGGFRFAEATALYRLELSSGQLTETLPLNTTVMKFYSLGFSPNDRRLAYFDLDIEPFSLIIHDLQTGEDQVLIMDNRYNTGGNLIWSDSNKLLTFSAANYNSESDSYLVSLLLWNNEQKILSTLIENSDIALEPIKWNGESKIVLQTMFSFPVSNYEFDLETNTLSYLNP